MRYLFLWHCKEYLCQANIDNCGKHHCIVSGVIFLDFYTIMYTFSSYPISSLQIYKRVIFCHSNLTQSIDISLSEIWSWKCDSRPFSSHLNEPWGMRIIQYFGCTLSPMCKADTASAGLPKGMLILHAFPFDQCKFDSLLLGFFPDWVFYVKTGEIKFPTQ